MSLITKVLKQKACYWAPGLPNDYGQLEVIAPVEIACRWDNESKEVIRADGTKAMTTATVMVAVDVAVGGMMVLGGLSSLINPVEPRENGALEILSFTKTPNMKATEFLRTVFL